MKRLLLFSALLCTILSSALSQSVGINNASPDSNAILDVTSTAKGILIPRMTKAQRNAISYVGYPKPAGLLVYQTDDSTGFWYWNSTGWVMLPGQTSSVFWNNSGNAGTSASTHFIGTTDSAGLSFRINNYPAGKLDIDYKNTAFGLLSGSNTITGYYNTFLGYQTGTAITNASNNVGIGWMALFKTTTGGFNVAIGPNCLQNNVTGIDNTAVGNTALYANVGSQNSAFGSHSLNNNSSGIGNSAFGYNALYSNTTASSNSAFGHLALNNNTIGTENTGFGRTVLTSNVAGSGSTAMGFESMRYANSASGLFTTYNSAFGYQALRGSTTAASNTGTANSAFGYQALYSATSGGNNTAFGSSALFTNASGTNNTAIGKEAGYSMSAGTGNVFLGYQAGYSETGSGKLYIANSNTATPLIYGDFTTGYLGISTNTPGAKLDVNGNLKFTGTDTIYSSTGTALTLRSGDGTGNGGALTIRGGNAGVPSGGSGGDLNLNAGGNMPSGGVGYGGLGTPGNVNINGSGGYNSVGGAINIVAGQSSYWALSGGVHADVNIKGGMNLAASDAAKVVVEGGYTFSSSNANSTGGNLLLQSGLGAGSGVNGNIQMLNGNVGIKTSTTNSALEINGAIAPKFSSQSGSSAVTLDNTASVWYFTGTASITLPAASTCTNRMYIVVNRTAGAKTISSYTDLSGSASTSIPANNSVTLSSDGTSWLQIK